jgi:hypothetical protein
MDNAEDKKANEAKETEEEEKDVDAMEGVLETGDLKRKRPQDDDGGVEGKKAKTEATDQEQEVMPAADGDADPGEAAVKGL